MIQLVSEESMKVRSKPRASGDDPAISQQLKEALG